MDSAKSKDQKHYSSSSDSEDDDQVGHISKDEIKKKSHVRTSVSAEAFGKYHQRSVFEPKKVNKTTEQVSMASQTLLKNFMFASLDEKQQKIVVDAVEVKEFKKDEYIIKQGEDGNVMYIIQDGELDCYKKFKKDEDPKLVKSYKPGDSFGELALLYNAPRAATIQAKTDGLLFVLDRETFNAIVKDAEVKRRERFESVLQNCDLFSTMDPYERIRLGDVFKIVKAKKGDFVIKQGEEGNIFYIIEEGTAIATKVLQGKTDAETVFSYKSGDYFGELALLNNEPRQANVIAESDMSLLSLDRATFDRILGPLKEILARNAKKYEKFI